MAGTQPKVEVNPREITIEVLEKLLEYARDGSLEIERIDIPDTRGRRTVVTFVEKGVERIPEPATAGNYNECPSEDCPMCSGESCNLCGAGSWNKNKRDCQHDCIDRHRESELPENGR